MSLILFTNNMEERIEERIREAIRRYKPYYVYAMLSGGKDSALATYYTLKATQETIIVFIHIVGQTHTDNVRAVYRFLDELEEKIGIRIHREKVLCRNKNDLRVSVYRIKEYPTFVHAVCGSYTLNGLDYWSSVEKFGFPALSSRFGAGKRWCCAEFKTLWLNTLPPNTPRRERVIVSGVKKSDSSYRDKKYDGYINVFKDHVRYTDITVMPLIDLNDIEVFALLKKHGFTSILKQYEKWGRSPNCVLCPFMSKKQFKKVAENLPPQYLANIKKRLEKLKTRYRENTFAYKKITEWLQEMETHLYTSI